jgi:capping protein beta
MAEEEQQPEPEPEPIEEKAGPNPTIKECIQLNQLMPIIDIDKNIDAISSVIYDNDDLLNEFLQKVDNRTKVCKEDPKGEFIMCEQNRDGDSYRSPISNNYFPPTDDAKYPSEPLRKLEETLNKMFKIYVRLYYTPSTLCSVYCWELGETLSEGYGVAVLIKNSLTDQKKINTGSWDSSNLITVTFEDESSGKKKAKYNLISTVNLAMSFNSKICGKVCLSGTITRSSHFDKIVNDYTNDEAHITNIGVLVEEMENSIRNTLDTVYCMKSKQIIDTARYNPTEGKPGIAQANALKEVWKGGAPVK